MNIVLKLEDSFAQAEQSFAELSQALVSGEPVALAQSSARLQRAALEFSLLLGRLPPEDSHGAAFKLRMKKLAAGLSVRRESLIRRTVLVDRALNTLVPATVKSTYGAGGKTYAAVGKQTGAFKYLAA
jgi:hypothetical protein